jgi:hypothetical protein
MANSKPQHTDAYGLVRRRELIVITQLVSDEPVC